MNEETNLKKVKRPSKENYYLGIAKAVSERSTCLRRQYGAVIVKHDRIVSTGYNGSPRGEENCCDKGYCHREAMNLPHGKCYDSSCPAVHAENNAIIQANPQDLKDSVLYLYGSENGNPIESEPCEMCKRIIKNAGISKVIGSSEISEYVILNF